jgi:hypothetical protein
MGRAYNVIDSDGPVLETLNLWGNYIDPAFRDRRRDCLSTKRKEHLRTDDPQARTGSWPAARSPFAA